MKKFICVVLSIMLLLSVFAPAAYAAAADPVYPTIIVAGYSSSNLYENNNKVWKLDMNGILNTVLGKIAQIGRGLGELALQRPDYLTDLVGKEILNLAGKLAFNPDGTSVYDLHTYYQDAEHTQFSYLYANGEESQVHEAVIMADIAAQYGSNGNDYIFSYQQDFRMSMVDCAANLDKYVDSVLEFTGADKVNIFAVSHGGQTVAAYLAMYGLEKNVVNNAVLTVPAIGGAALAYDVMSEQVALDEETLLYFIENGQMLEADINWLVRAHQFGILDKVCNGLVHRYVKQILGYWGSMWDFIPLDYYDELKSELLDPAQSAALIEKSDYFHYNILANMTEILNNCVTAGMNIYIVAGAGMPSVTGLQEQSDAIITVNAATGAKTAPYGLRFNDGYIQQNSVCADVSHNHLSPDMTIDASCAYLPEYTWIVNGMYHGMTWKDEYSVDLCKTLLFSNSRVDVHTYKQFPQFKYSSNRNYSVTATLDQSPQGYWTSADTALVVTNLSHKYKMRITSITVEGVDARFDVKKPVFLDPQASCTFEMSGSIPSGSLTTADITVNYSLIGSITPLGSRTLVFTRLNGAPITAYDSANPYTAAYRETAFEKGVSDSAQTFLRRTGVFDFLKMIVNSLLTIMRIFRIK